MQKDRLLDKIKNHKNLQKEIRKQKSKGKTIVQCHGVFDLVHPGHIYYFNQARQLGDIVVVSVVNDKYTQKGPGRPYFPEKLRMEWLASLSQIDYVTLCDSPGPWEVMEAIRPDIYVKGKDTMHLLDDATSGLFKDKETIEKLGGKMHFTETLPIHSPDLIQEFFKTTPPEIEVFLNNFKLKYSKEEIKKIIRDIIKAKLKVLIIGETIIDEYHYVLTLGKPSKSNVMSTKYMEKEGFPGGALAYANHMRDFCPKIDLLTYLGKDDSKEEYIRSNLKKNINPILFFRNNAPTIIKRRFVDSIYLGKLFEVSFINDNHVEKNVETEIIKWLNGNIKKYDLVIAADYGHGLLTPKIIDILSKKAKFLAVNAQVNSVNQGINPVIKYPRADYACIDEQEARLSVHDRFSDIKEIIAKICKKVSVNKFTVTMGKKGSLTYDKKTKFTEVPSFASKVVDPVGAGDAYLAISSLGAVSNLNNLLVGFLGNIAASMATKIVCNRSSIKLADFMKEIDYLLG